MSEAEDGQCPTVPIADPELIYQALRFFFWAAGEGISPAKGDHAEEPEECFWQYGLRTGDEDWETVAERYRVAHELPQGIER